MAASKLAVDVSLSIHQIPDRWGEGGGMEGTEIWKL